jgi:hypothetical protein
MRDGLSTKRFRPLIAPAAAVTDTTAIVSSIIDCLGYDAVSLVIVTGTNADADATATVLLEEGDASNLSDAAAVADADMVSMTNGTAPETAAAFTFADDGETRCIGYIGNKRYIRLTVTPVGNTGNQFLAGVAVLEGKTPGVSQLGPSGT